MWGHFYNYWLRQVKPGGMCSEFSWGNERPPPQRARGILRCNMKLALNGATTMRADLATDLQAAKSAGFDYLEIWAAKLRAFLKERSTSELKDLFSQSGLSPLSINSIEHVTFRDAQAYESIKQECEELSRIASDVGCPCIVVVPGRLPQGGASRDERDRGVSQSV